MKGAAVRRGGILVCPDLHIIGVPNGPDFGVGYDWDAIQSAAMGNTIIE